MKKLLNILFVFLTVFTGAILPQNQPTEYEKLQNLYLGLEYNTIAFSDLKQKWIISDPLLVREIYNRFIVRDALREGGERLSLQTVKDKTVLIQDGRVVIDLRKRYYDDEIEFFAFVDEADLQKTDPRYVADPVRDGFLLREIVGPLVYEKIRTQGYFFSNLTKTTYDTKSGYFYNVYLNMLEPNIMYWSTTSAGRNKYLVSAFGKWGNDKLLLPGWYHGDFAFGSALTYYSAISNDTRDYLYDVRIGTVTDTKRPFKGDLKGKRLLTNTGQSVYGRVSGDVLKYMIDGAEGYYLTLEGKYTINDYKNRDFGFKTKDTVFTNRDYYIIGVNKRGFYDFGDLGLVDAGAGLTVMDIYRYEIDPKASKFRAINGKRTVNFLGMYVEAGLSRIGGLLQHNISAMLSVDATGVFAAGVKSQVMLSDLFGFDIRIFQAFGIPGEQTGWRPASYIVFSPVFRINY